MVGVMARALAGICLPLCASISWASPRMPLPPAPELAKLLYHQNFDSAFYSSPDRPDSVTTDYGTLVSSWSGYALLRSGAVTPFVVPALDSNGCSQVSCGDGCIRFWVTPLWSSASVDGGNGPGAIAHLADLVITDGQTSETVFSLQVTADGSNLLLIGLGEGGPVVLLNADIAWTSGTAYCVAINYGTNTALFVGSQKVAEAGPTLAVPANVARLVVGSAYDGTGAAGSAVDEVSVFGRPLTETEMAFYYGVYSDTAALGPMPDVLTRASPTTSASSAIVASSYGAMYYQSPDEPFGSFQGCGNCVTNGPLYLTNFMASIVVSNSIIPTDTVSVAFCVFGGTLGSEYSLFRATNVMDLMTNADWVQFVHPCDSVFLTNRPIWAEFYRVAPRDFSTEGDGIPNWWKAIYGLPQHDPSVASADPDDDGVSNLQEYTNGTNPFDDMLVSWGDNVNGESTIPWGFGPAAGVAAGGGSGAGGFTLVLTPQGTVIAFGANNYGQTNVPPGLSNVLAVAAGGDQCAALKSNWTVVQWGRTNAPVPLDLTNAVAISAGYQSMLALRANGTVVSWGVSNSPANSVPSGLNGVKAIGAGWNANVALRTNGAIVSWGWGGQALGWNLTNAPNLTDVAAISVGALHSTALRSNGTVSAWGWNYSGETNVPAGLSNVTAISAGRAYTLALGRDGTVSGFGGGLPALPAGLGQITNIVAGPAHALAVRKGVLTPLILRSPQSQAKVAGDSATFKVSAWSRRQPAYHWQFNDADITGATNDTFVVTNVQSSNLGQYRARVSNGAGSVYSAEATLEMILPPSILSPVTPQTVWVRWGDTTNLSVSAVAQGMDLSPLNYFWYKDGQIITWAMNSSNLDLGGPPGPPAQDGQYWVTVVSRAASTNSPTWTVHVGTVAAWGGGTNNQVLPPPDLQPVALAGGGGHALGLREDGTVAGFGANDFGQSAVPPGLSNVIGIAAGEAHSLALKADGTVVAFGNNSAGQTNVPNTLTNAIAVSAGGDQSLALTSQGTVAQWGQTNAPVPAGLTNVIAIASGTNFHLALLSNSTVVAWGANGSGQTTVPAGLTNVVAIAAGGAHALALRQNGTVTAWGSNASGETNVPPDLTNAMGIAAGYAVSEAVRNDGTVVVWGTNQFGQARVPAALKNVKQVAAGRTYMLAEIFSSLIQYPVDVSKDLLIIYNTNSVNSIVVKDYYLAHRPMVSGANVLGIGCTNTETFFPDQYTNLLVTPVQNWLNANPTKRPQYVTLFLDVPSRVNTNGDYSQDDPVNKPTQPSVQFQLDAWCAPGWQPFVTHINMNGTNDCKAYVDKLQYFGTNYSPGKLLISASGGGYQNTNYYFEDAQSSHPAFPFALQAMQGVTSNGVPPSSVDYLPVTSTTHITRGTNVAGYLTWGANGGMGGNYYTNVLFQGNSSWYLIETIESFNGIRGGLGQGNFTQWFSSIAFGGTSYSNTPIGAVTHVDEPQAQYVENSQIYFGLWAVQKNFAICAWNSRRTPYFQAVGDPFVTK
jgi:alpha-tubulin suppressor-like RCC1 family protein